VSDEAETQPMLETILKELRDMRASFEKRFDVIESHLERIEIRLDKIESIALEARATARETQLDLKRLREQLNLPVS
jgi:hypothetical protein